MESEYKKVVSGVITRTSSIWGLSEETSISLDQGEAMRILPRPDGAAVVQFYLYDRLDDHRDLQNLDII